MKRRTLLAAGAATLAAPLPALAQPSGTIRFYSSMVLDVVEPIIAEFHRRSPGIRVDLLYSGSVQLEQRIFAELEAGDLQADVIWAANPALFLNLKGRGALMNYASPHAEALPPVLRDADGAFYAGRVHNMGIGYHTRMVPQAQVPRTWRDFLEFGPRAARASPLHSGTNFNIMGAFVKTPGLGWEWFEEARRRGVRVVRGTGDVTRGLTSGEFAVIQGIDYILAAEAARGAPVAFTFPTDGVLTLPSPIGLGARGRNTDAGKVFLDFNLSQEGQKMLVERHFLPVRTDVEPPPGLPSPSEIKALEVDFAWLAENGADLRRRFSELF